MAIVCHPLTTWGGAEYNTTVLAKIFHKVTIYTSYFDEDFVKENLNKFTVKASFLQKIPFRKKLGGLIVPFLPFAYYLLNLKKHDLVIVVTDGFEKFIRVGRNADLIHYILTPPRFLWMKKSSYTRKDIFYLIYKKIVSFFIDKVWKYYDKKFAKKADLSISISEAVQKRVAKYYGKDSVIVYPPVEVTKMKYNRNTQNREDWFLYLGRVETYKGVEIAIKACIKNGLKLKVAGTGNDLERMKNLVNEMKIKHLVGFMGFVSEKMKRELLYKCKALIYPVYEEDFGIVPVEANASGCPVIAYKSGGVIETIKEGETGAFFDEWNEDSLSEVLSNFDKMSFSGQKCNENSMSFSREIYENKMKGIINGLTKR